MGAGDAAVNDAQLGRLTALPPDGVHTLRLTVTDKAANTASALIQFLVDTTPPTSPVGLTATVQNRRDVVLTWTPNSESDLAGYALYRNGTRIAQDLIDTAGYIDIGVAEGKHSYHVTAIDKAGNESGPSNQTNVTISLASPVAQIVSPARNAVVAGVIEVKGTAYSPREFKEYRLLVGEGAAPPSFALLRRSPVATQGDVLAQWNTIGLRETGSYTLRLEAEDTYGNLAVDTVTVTVDNLLPAKPTGLHASASDDDVTLTWNANTEPDLDGYLLYRDGRLANASGPVVGDLRRYLVRGTSYLDEAVPDGTRVYTLVAVDLAGNESEPSDPARAAIDVRGPHVTIVQPEDGARVDGVVHVLAVSPDTDIATVHFQYKPAAATVWTDIDPVATQAPYRVDWNPEGLDLGDYNLRAIATDMTGEVDSNPHAILVTYTVLKRPLPPQSLAVRVQGGDVVLNWDASPSAATRGYLIDRTDAAGATTRVTGEPVSETTHTDTDVADGEYSYAVYAIDVYGNLSDPAGPAPASIFTPTVKQPYTPTARTTVSLSGSGRPHLATSVHLTSAGGTASTTVSADGEGRFELADIDLPLGDNRFAITQQDAHGNVSKAARAHVLVGTPPSAPTGLVATASGLDALLTWEANPEPDVVGYFFAENGEPRTEEAAVISVTASSEATSADAAADHDPNTSWWPEVPVSTAPQWVELTLARSEMIRHIEVTWAVQDDWLYGARDFDVEGWDGEAWVPLGEVRGNDRSASSLILPEPYLTNRIRFVLLTERNPEWGVEIAEITVHRLLTTVEASARIASRDGRQSFSVTAFNESGLAGSAATVELGVGDATPPEAVTLSGGVQDADVHLFWTASDASDVDRYEIQRDGQVWREHTDLDNLSTTDAALPNGTYRYRVVAIDAKGNRGEPSNEVVLVVDVPPPPQVSDLVVSAPLHGGALDLAWSPPKGSATPARYGVLRGTVSGGPYTLLTAAEMLDTTYRDTGLTDGVRYFYRVFTVDAFGNRGAESNEASGVPGDAQPPDAPALVYPAIPAVPTTVGANHVSVMGFAEPGARVRLSVNGREEGAAVAAPVEEVAHVWATGDTFSLSPDGRLVAVGRRGQIQLFQFVRKAEGEVASPVRTLSYALAGRLAWSPHSRHLAFVDEVRDATTGDWSSTLRYLSLDDDQVRTISAVAPTASGIAWASNGKRLFAAGAATDGSGVAGLWSVDVATGAASLLLDGGGAYIADVAAAPDGNSVAYVRDGQLEILDLGTKNAMVVPSASAAGSPVWSFDGKSLLYSDYGWPVRIMRYDLAAGAPSVVTDGTISSDSPAWSPDGKRIAYVHDVPVIRDLDTGVERQLGQVWGADLHWTQSGYLAYRVDEDAGYVARHRPAGHFSLHAVALMPGDNDLIVRAVDAAGNTGPESPSSRVIYSTADRSDLVVSTADIAVLPAMPNPSEKARITVTVRNEGQRHAAESDITLLAIDAANNSRTLYEGPLPALEAGASHSLFIDWTAPSAGLYRLGATVDRMNQVLEVSERNNVAVRELRVADTAAPALEVTTDETEYLSDRDVRIHAKLVNGGAEFSGVLELAIEDMQGYVVTTLPATAVAVLAYGQAFELDFVWNTANTWRGNYRVHVRLKDMDDVLSAEATAAFAITRPFATDAFVATDSAEYGANYRVSILGSATTDRAAQGMMVQARFRVVRDATVVFQDMQDVPLGAYVELRSGWDTGVSPPGDYAATLDILADGAVAASASSPFKVTAPPMDSLRLTGKLKLSRSRLQVGESLLVDATVLNEGNVGILHLPVTIRVVDPSSGQTLASHQGALDLEPGGAAELQASFAAEGWPLRSLAVLLEADRSGAALATARAGGTAPQLLDQQILSLFTAELPLAEILSPQDGSYRQTAGIMIATAHGQQASIVGAEYQIDGDHWTALAAAGTDEYHVPLPALADGPHSLAFRATDQFGNVSETVRADVTVDGTAPLIVIDGVAEGGRYTTAVPAVSISDANLATTHITLNGMPYTPATPITRAGDHVLDVTAEDRAGNRSQQVIRFAVQATATTVHGIPANGMPLPLLPFVVVLVWLAYRPIRSHFNNNHPR